MSQMIERDEVLAQYKARRPHMMAFTKPIISFITVDEFDEARDRLELDWEPGDDSPVGKNALDLLVECCLFNLWSGGKTVLMRYAERHPPAAGTFNECVLQSYLDSHCSVYEVERTEPGAFVWLRDTLYGGEPIRLVDIALSLTAQPGAKFLTRISELDGISTVVGSVLPVAHVDLFPTASGGRDFSKYTPAQFAALSPEERSELNTDMVRAAVQAGGVLHTLQVGPALEAIHNRLTRHRQSDRVPQLVSASRVGRNDPCPCGSGHKYKKCCYEG